MRKNKTIIHTSRLFPLSAPARLILSWGLPLIFLSLLRLLFEVQARGEFSIGTANLFGKMLEFPVAAFMLVTCGALLADFAVKKQK